MNNIVNKSEGAVSAGDSLFCGHHTYIKRYQYLYKKNKLKGGEKIMKQNWSITATIAIVVGLITFYSGMQYQKTRTASNLYTAQVGQNGQPGQNGMMGSTGQGQRKQGVGQFGMRRGNGGAAIGDVISVDAQSITVKLQDGSSKIINISASTTYNKTETATAADIKVGNHISAFGTTNSDGTITAQNVQLNPNINRIGGNGQGISPSPMEGKGLRQ
jgi:hypothetical protein